MTYRDRIFALAATWRLGDSAAGVLALLPAERRVEAREANPAEKLTRLLRREQAWLDSWGRKRWGAAWDRLDPRVRARLVERDGRDH